MNEGIIKFVTCIKWLVIWGISINGKQYEIDITPSSIIELLVKLSLNFGMEICMLIGTLFLLAFYKKRKGETFQDTINRFTGANKKTTKAELLKKQEEIIKQIKDLKDEEPS